MAIVFNGQDRLISLTTGTTMLDVRDLYSRWKDWILLSDNSKFPPAFSTTGGDPIDQSTGTSIPLYAFLVNGWKVKPQEANHTLNVSGGVLLVSGGGDPFVNTTGNYVIRINYQQPVQAITVATGGGGGGGLTQQQVRDAMNIAATNTPNPGSIDIELEKIKQNTNLIPGLF